MAYRESSPPPDNASVFWVSLAELMSSLMAMFLVTTVIVLLTFSQPAPLTKPPQPTKPPQALLVRAEPRAGPAHPAKIEGSGPEQTAQVDEVLLSLVGAFSGLRYDKQHRVIDFGDLARFATADDRLDAESAQRLRRFVGPLITVLEQASAQGEHAVVVIEGFADQRGDYLFNLNLSLRRAQRVICVLLETGVESELSEQQRLRVRERFVVGGHSFNRPRGSLQASRRIQMRLELSQAETGVPAALPADLPQGRCGLR